MESHKSDEIDLLELLARFFNSLKRNLALTILLPLGGIIVALVVRYNSNDLFESSILVETSLLTENECKFLFDQLDKFGVIPGLTKEEDKKVAGFKFEVTKNEAPVLGDKSVYLQLTAQVYDEKVFPLLQNALVKFVNESPSVVRHRIEREKFYTDMIKRIESEIASMDEVKSQINNQIQATYLNPAELYANSVKLYEEKAAFEMRLDEIKSVHLVKGFDSLTVDARLNPVIVSLMGFIIGFFVLCVVLFLRFFINYYKKYETTH